MHFRISSRELPIVYDPYQKKTYGPFIIDTIPSGPGADSIEVEVETKDFPDTAQLTQIFETPDSWSMYSDGEQYFWMDIAASPAGGPICAARFHRLPGKATVYCGGPYIEEVNGDRRLLNPVRYPLDQLLLMYALAEKGGACIHACATDFNGKGYLFPGRSGAGKSTISRIFISGNHDVLSDDRVVVRKTGDAFRIFGTPWAGDAEIAQNKDLPLQGIFFILHGNENRAEKISPREAFERLMPVTSIPWYDEKVMPDLLSFCEDLVLHVPAYVLHFTPDRRATDLIEELLSDKEIHGAIT